VLSRYSKGEGEIRLPKRETNEDLLHESTAVEQSPQQVGVLEEAVLGE